MFWKRTKHEIDNFSPEYIILDTLFVYLCKNISTFVYLCVFMCFLVFTLFNIVFVNNLTIALILACFAYTFQSWYLSYAKAWVSGRESMGFRLWKQGFHDVKSMLSDRNLMPFSKRSPCISKLYIYAILAARRNIGKNMGTHTYEIGSESSAK